jgi:hypothetical protein
MILPKGKAKIMESLEESKKHLQEELPLFCIANPILLRLLVFSAGCFNFFKLMILQKRICYFVFDGKTPFDS